METNEYAKYISRTSLSELRGSLEQDNPYDELSRWPGDDDFEFVSHEEIEEPVETSDDEDDEDEEKDGASRGRSASGARRRSKSGKSKKAR